MADQEAKWYIIHTYSGYENKVAADIMKLVENRNLQNLIEDVYVPTIQVPKLDKDGKQVVDKEGNPQMIDEKVYPSYVFVKMIHTDESWFICRNTRGVTGFVSANPQKPIPLSEEEVQNLGIVSRGISLSFEVGDTVEIKSGPFEGESGTVKAIDYESKTLRVDLFYLGRIMPTEFNLEETAIGKL